MKQDMKTVLIKPRSCYKKFLIAYVPEKTYISVEAAQESASLLLMMIIFQIVTFYKKMDTQATNHYLILLLIIIIIVDTISNNNMDILALIIFLREGYDCCLMQLKFLSF